MIVAICLIMTVEEPTTEMEDGGLNAVFIDVHRQRPIPRTLLDVTVRWVQARHSKTHEPLAIPNVLLPFDQLPEELAGVGIVGRSRGGIVGAAASKTTLRRGGR